LVAGLWSPVVGLLRASVALRLRDDNAWESPTVSPNSVILSEAKDLLSWHGESGFLVREASLNMELFSPVK
jgi:hypothetical protein